MKLKRLFIAGLFLFLSSSHSRAEGEIGMPIQYLPAIPLDFRDLDARDAQNRPVLDAAANGELLVLFQRSAAQLLSQADVHYQAAMQMIIISFSSLFNGAFIEPMGSQFQRIMPALFNVLRRVVHNVHKLWTTFSDDASARKSSGSFFSLSKKPQKLFLRC